ncbi:MAG TPA: hypothetical protein VNT31_14260 [Nocardioides sp.]|nr:hypothetical protein [Nocardioides sp.]
MVGLGVEVRRMIRPVTKKDAGVLVRSLFASLSVPTVAGRPRRRRLVMLVGVLTVVLAGAAGAAAWRVDQLDDRDSAGVEAVAAVRERVPLLLSYRYATLEEDLDTALDQTAGDFTDEYGDLIDDVVRSAATDRRIITEANVNAAGVVSIEGDDEVVVLVFLTQSTTSRNTPDPAISGSRVEVTMRRVGSDWLIAGLETR